MWTKIFRISFIYQNADVVVAKGQANYESLSEEDKNIYFLLMAKCKVIAEYIGVKEKALVCMRSKRSTLCHKGN